MRKLIVQSLPSLPQFNQAFMSVFKYAAIAGFIVTATLLINMNFVAFNKVFKNHSKKMMWLFMIIALFPFLLILLAFSFFFKV
jgi:hypothetical protein